MTNLSRLLALAVLLLSATALITGCSKKNPNDDAAQKALAFREETFNKYVKESREKLDLQKNELHDAILQTEALLYRFKSRYSDSLLKENALKVANGEQPYGAAETQQYKDMDWLDSELSRHYDEMSDSTKKAYDKYLKLRKSTRGF